MDVTAASEPPATERLRAFVKSARSRFDGSQAYTIERWSTTVRFEAMIINDLHRGRHDVASLRFFASAVNEDNQASDARLAMVARLLAIAADKPALASAALWSAIGRDSPELASHLVHFVRARAALPGLRTRIAADEPMSVVGDYHVGWFLDRQFEDAAVWVEAVPAPHGDTLDEVVAATQGQREAAPRVPVERMVAFLRRASSFFLHLSSHGLDPLGFKLRRDAQLVVDPGLEERVALADWARHGGRAICLRGHVAILRIPVEAPWPFTLELIAAELGRGGCGGIGLMLRLTGEMSVATTVAPLMLCLPDEPIEEWGARFERWTMRSFAHAVDAWRPWC